MSDDMLAVGFFVCGLVAGFHAALLFREWIYRSSSPLSGSDDQ